MRLQIPFIALALLSCCKSQPAVDRTTEANRNTTTGRAQSTLEDIYVVRARPSTENLPVTAFCDDAHFPETHPPERERSYEYFSVETRSADGLIVNPAAQAIGGHRGCYSRTADGRLYTYGKGTFGGVTFTIRGTCLFAPERSPQPEVAPYTCDYAHTDMAGYIGGQSLWNGVTTDRDGYITTTIGTIRLWKAR
jgi:hypothetical protein